MLTASPQGHVSVADRESSTQLRQAFPCNGNLMVMRVSEGLEVRQFSSKKGSGGLADVLLYG